MSNVAIIGAGIAGVTTAYRLLQSGHSVTLFDRHPYAAMETSYANGGQLSACNAEVWNSWSTVLKGMKWMLQPGAPLLFNPKPSWHKLSWVAEFLAAIPRHRDNTITTARLAIEARGYLTEMARNEGIDFNREDRGILHFYRTEAEFRAAERTNALLAEGGLARRAVTPEEIRAIEPNLQAPIYGGFYTESDFTGDIHKFTVGLAEAIRRKGGVLRFGTEITKICAGEYGVDIRHRPSDAPKAESVNENFDRVVVSAGVHSRAIAQSLGDRVNIYPVKGYSITVALNDAVDQMAAPWTSLLDDKAKIVSSRLGANRLRVAGTAEFNGFNKDIRAERIAPLVEWCRQNFPGMSTREITPWAGLRPMMPDMMPRVFQGRNPNVFYNTGHGHLGWTLSAVTAEMVTNLLDGRAIEARRPLHPVSGSDSTGRLAA